MLRAARARSTSVEADQATALRSRMNAGGISPVSRVEGLPAAAHQAIDHVRTDVTIDRGIPGFIRCCAVIAILVSPPLSLDASGTQDRGVSIEEVAADVARLSNQNSRRMLDDSVLAMSARAEGRNVVFEYIVEDAVRPEEYKKNLRTLTIRSSCLVNQDNEAFRRGLFYTFVYRNSSGRELVQFEVNAAICSGLLPWIAHRDPENGFTVGHPQGWNVMPNGSVNIKFTVGSLEGVCNVIVRAQPQLRNLTQDQLDKEVTELPDDQASWAQYMGPSVTLDGVLESRRTQIGGVRALLGVTESRMKGQYGPLASKTLSAMAFTPGKLWVLTCQSSRQSIEQARIDFDSLRPTFDAFFASFALLP
jgi:hypothetical protein